MRPTGLAALGLLLICACSQPSLAATPVTVAQSPASPTPAPSNPAAPRTPTPAADREVAVLTRAQLRQNVLQHLYTQPDAETLARSANGSLQGQRVQIRGLVRRVQLGDTTTHYSANGFRASNWLSVDTASGSAVDGQVSVLYGGDVSVLRAGQSVVVFGRVQGYDPASTNGFAAKPGPPLVVAEFVADRLGLP
jgi:hypothetical protein